MIDLAINGIVLRPKTDKLGDVAGIEVLGKSLGDWAGAAIGATYKTLDYSPVINMCEKLRAAVDRAKPVTVVLFGDAPLVAGKTVAAAVKHLTDNKLGAYKLARGFVFKTDFIFDNDQLFLQAHDADKEFDAVTDGVSLARVTDVLKQRILRYHADKGVIIRDFQNTYIDCDVAIEKDVVIEPYNFIKGKTIIKSGAHIMPGNYIENAVIDGNAKIDSSRLYSCVVGSGTTVGPFAYLRPNAVVGAGCRIGDFVELKSCIIGDGSKVSHLTYIGDAELGKDCNVGCGVVFANYDGKNKYKSVVGERVFIGSNANIVAPVEIADRSFIAAGSTITKSVPSQALAIARARQTLIPDWQGNAYAPPTGAIKKSTYNLIQYSDGIIDGNATDVKNEDKNQ